MTKFLVLMLVFGSIAGFGQVIIPTEPTEKSAEMQVESEDKAVLFPRLNSSEINAISNPAHGLLIYSTSQQSFVYNIGNEGSPQWQVLDNLILNTTAEIEAIPTPTSGDIRYNTTTKSIFYYNGLTKVWEIQTKLDPAFLVLNQIKNLWQL